MEEILGLATSAAGGGLLGIFGTVASRGLGLVERRQKRKDRESEQAHELALLRLQQEQAGEEREHEAALVEYQGAIDFRTATVEHDASLKGASQWVQNIRATVRPLLTYFVFFSHITAFALLARSDEAIRAQGFEDLAFSTFLCLTWWFGERSAGKAARGAA